MRTIPNVTVTLLALLALLAVGGMSAGCSKPEVCTGLGIETRPLVGVLADVGVPAGGLQCDGARDAEWIVNHRTVQVGENADAGFAAWKTHLESRGWHETTTPMELAENGIAEAAARAGHPISSCTARHLFQKEGVVGTVAIGVGYCVTNKPGWTQVAYNP